MHYRRLKVYRIFNLWNKLNEETAVEDQEVVKFTGDLIELPQEEN